MIISVYRFKILNISLEDFYKTCYVMLSIIFDVIIKYYKLFYICVCY